MVVTSKIQHIILAGIYIYIYIHIVLYCVLLYYICLFYTILYYDEIQYTVLHNDILGIAIFILYIPCFMFCVLHQVLHVMYASI